MTFYVVIGKWARPHIRAGKWEFRVCFGWVAICIGLFDVEAITARAMHVIDDYRKKESAS